MVILGGEDGVCYLYDIRKINQDAKEIGKIQRDGHCIKKIQKMDGKENEVVISNANGNVWQWNVDKLESIETTAEWTGNEQFGINDFAMANGHNKMYVATKRG